VKSSATCTGYAACCMRSARSVQIGYDHMRSGEEGSYKRRSPLEESVVLGLIIFPYPQSPCISSYGQEEAGSGSLWTDTLTDRHDTPTRDLSHECSVTSEAMQKWCTSCTCRAPAAAYKDVVG
jgi:hypothetical protein